MRKDVTAKYGACPGEGRGRRHQPQEKAAGKAEKGQGTDAGGLTILSLRMRRTNGRPERNQYFAVNTLKRSHQIPRIRNILLLVYRFNFVNCVTITEI
jgi:hypothetical protein